jgi:DNA-binding IscR family transcriptional regulator
MNKEMLNTKEVASYSNINEKQVYRLISELKRLGIDPGAINPPNP